MKNKIKERNYIKLFFYLFCTVLLIDRQIQAQDNVHSKEQYEPVQILNTLADFSGWVGPDTKSSGLKAIKIGLFMPANLNAGVRNAANLAIMEINNSGGYEGIPFRLISRWASDPWGAGSKEIIKLIYQDSVWAIIGSINGEATHIAEQIVTKSWLPLISPVSADPTLNYINIPWIFRLPPDFRIQSKIIVEKGIRQQSITRIGLITSTDHDGRIFSEDMLDALSENNYTPLFHFKMPSSQIAFDEIVAKIAEFYPEGLIINLLSQDMMLLFSELNKKQNKVICFIPWIPGLDIEALSKNINIKFYYLEPFPTGSNEVYNSFAEKYFCKFGRYPAADAAYTYDAVYIFARALIESGLNRAKLRDAIARSYNMSGVTGNINWDNGGGNTALPLLRVSKNMTTESIHATDIDWLKGWKCSQ